MIVGFAFRLGFSFPKGFSMSSAQRLFLNHDQGPGVREDDLAIAQGVLAHSPL